MVNTTKELLTKEINICSNESVLLKMLSKLTASNKAKVCPKCGGDKLADNKFCKTCQVKLATAANELNVPLKSLERSVMITINRKVKGKTENDKDKDKDKDKK